MGDLRELSSNELGLWFIHRLTGGSIAYNIHASCRVDASLEREALFGALRSVVGRHEALRTIYPVADGEPERVVLKALEVPLHTVKHPISQAMAVEVLDGDLRRPFHIETEPPVRGLVLELDTGETIIALVHHHIISDGWSGDILLSDLAHAYRASQGEESPLPPVEVPYRQWAAEGAGAEAGLDYWVASLSKPASFLEKRGASAVSINAAHHEFEVGPNDWSALQQLARRGACSSATTLLAAFQVCLAIWSGEDDIVIGHPFANRRSAAVHQTVGLFVNLLPVRVKVKLSETFVQLARTTQSVIFASLEHQETPLSSLVRALNPRRVPGTNALFQIAFEFRDYWLGPYDFGIARGVAFHLKHQHAPRTSRLGLEVDMWPEFGAARGVATFDPSWINHGEVSDLVALYTSFLTWITSHADSPLQLFARR